MIGGPFMNLILAFIFFSISFTAIGIPVATNQIKQVVRVVGYVASVPTFTQQPAVVNGASELLLEIFGEKGKHARSAVGMAVLPLNAAVEIELTVEI